MDQNGNKWLIVWCAYCTCPQSGRKTLCTFTEKKTHSLCLVLVSKEQQLEHFLWAWPLHLTFRVGIWGGNTFVGEHCVRVWCLPIWRPMETGELGGLSDIRHLLDFLLNELVSLKSGSFAPFLQMNFLKIFLPFEILFASNLLLRERGNRRIWFHSFEKPYMRSDS